MPLSAVDLRLAKLEESPDLFVMCCRQQFVLKRVLNPCQAGNMLIQRHDILLTTSQQDAWYGRHISEITSWSLQRPHVPCVKYKKVLALLPFLTDVQLPSVFLSQCGAS